MCNRLIFTSLAVSLFVIGCAEGPATDVTAGDANDTAVGIDAALDDTDVFQADDGNLLHLLTDPTGCKTYCKPNKPCIIKCDSPQSDKWTDLCATEVKYFNDGKQTDDYCWDPPKKWCAGGAGLVMTTACSPDGTECCLFGNNCIPCDWQRCSSDKPCQGPSGPILPGDPKIGSTCSDQGPWWQIGACVICGETLLCKKPK